MSIYPQREGKWDKLIALEKGKSEFYLPSFSTNAIHKGQNPDPLTGSVNIPIHMSTTFQQTEPGKPIGNSDYIRQGNPTGDALNEALASLENARYALSFSSGLNAETSILGILSSGDHVICVDDMYGGTGRLMNRILTKFGMEFSLVDLTSIENLRKSFIKGKSKMLWLETPTNPTLKIIDINELSKISRELGMITVVDNTMASPVLQNPLELGCDIVIHSGTKYLSGHSDILCGAIMTNDENLYKAIKFNQLNFGGNLPPFEQYLLLRSLKTLELRVKKQTENARVIARYLNSHPMVEKTIYPGLESHPQHLIAKKQMRDFGAMISFVLKGDIESARLFLKNVKLFILAESLGSVESLIEIPALMTHTSVPKERRDQLGIVDTLFRISIGIEDVNDLLDDLERAFGSLK